MIPEGARAPPLWGADAAGWLVLPASSVDAGADREASGFGAGSSGRIEGMTGPYRFGEA